MPHSVIGTNFLYPAKKWTSSIITYPIALSLILLSYSSSFSYMVPNTQHISPCKQAAAQQFDKISHFLTNSKVPFMFTKT